MAYGAGKSRLLAAYGQEAYDERVKREQETRDAERAREVEKERKSLWSLALSTIGGAALGPIGVVGGTALGKAIGGAQTYRGEEVESYKLTSDVGMFERGEAEDIAAINRELERADRADVWGDVVDIGASAALAFTMGGGDITDPGTWGDFSATEFGGAGAAETGGYGKGVFGVRGGGFGFGEGTLWSKWFSNV